MKRTAMFLVFSALLAACAEEAPPPAAPEREPEPTPAQVDERRVGIYGALIPELVSSEGMRWRRVYVVTDLCTDPTELVEDRPESCDDTLSEAEQQALRDRLDVEQLRFIDDPTKLYDADWFEGAPNEVVVTLGPIVERADGVRVGASYLCGGLCGSGSTWVLEERDSAWTVVGTRGPTWIA
jgi:hypothetical protein